jgi:hypothetical protein
MFLDLKFFFGEAICAYKVDVRRPFSNNTVTRHWPKTHEEENYRGTFFFFFHSRNEMKTTKSVCFKTSTHIRPDEGEWLSFSFKLKYKKRNVEKQEQQQKLNDLRR